MVECLKVSRVRILGEVRAEKRIWACPPPYLFLKKKKEKNFIEQRICDEFAFS